MSTKETEISVETVELPDGGVAIASSSDSRCLRWLAALSAASVPYTVESAGRRPLIVVSPQFAESAIREIHAYEAVNRNWPPCFSEPATGNLDTCILAAVVVVVLLILAFLRVGPAGGADFAFDTAVLDSELVREGQLWRLVTALALHADFMHLLANCLCLALFATVVGSHLGFGLSWLLICLGGGLGNGLAVLAAREPFRAVGASTAVFAALGIAIVLRYAGLHRGRSRGRFSLLERRWIPLLAGLALLALLGGSEGTHLAGHLYGFIAGILIAVAALPCRKLRPVGLLQHLAFAAFLGINLWLWQAVSG